MQNSRPDNPRVTHYVYRPPAEDGWVQVPFLVREAGQPHGPFFLGHAREGAVSAQQVQVEEEQRTLRRLSFAYSIAEDQGLWITPEGEVWLASAHTPTTDNARILVDAQDLRTPDTTRRKTSAPRNAKDMVASRSGLMYWVSGDYVVNSEYQAFAHLTRKRFADLIGATKQDQLPASVHWDDLASEMWDNVFEFCEDPIFWYGYRQKLVDIVQFGFARSFTLIVVKGARPDHEILRKHDVPFLDKINFLYTHVPHLDIGLFSQTVAASYVETCLNTWSPAIPREKKGDCMELAGWCVEKPDRRVLICDHGIARDIVAIKPDKVQNPVSTDRLEWRRDGLECSYPDSIPVGFMYPEGDHHWRRTLEAAMREAVLQLWNNIPWEDVAKGLKPLDIEAFDLQTICHRLGLDDEYYQRTHPHLQGDASMLDENESNT